MRADLEREQWAERDDKEKEYRYRKDHIDNRFKWKLIERFTSGQDIAHVAGEFNPDTASVVDKEIASIVQWEVHDGKTGEY